MVTGQWLDMISQATACWCVFAVGCSDGSQPILWKSKGKWPFPRQHQGTKGYEGLCPTHLAAPKPAARIPKIHLQLDPWFMGHPIIPSSHRKPDVPCRIIYPIPPRSSVPSGLEQIDRPRRHGRWGRTWHDAGPISSLSREVTRSATIHQSFGGYYGQNWGPKNVIPWRPWILNCDQSYRVTSNQRPLVRLRTQLGSLLLGLQCSEESLPHDVAGFCVPENGGLSIPNLLLMVEMSF